jgi:hypothetical protein
MFTKKEKRKKEWYEGRNKEEKEGERERKQRK